MIFVMGFKVIMLRLSGDLWLKCGKMQNEIISYVVQISLNSMIFIG